MDRKNINPASIKAIVVNPPSTADGVGVLSTETSVVSSIKDNSKNNVEDSKDKLISTLSTFGDTVKKFNTMLDDISTKFEVVDAQIASEISTPTGVGSGKSYSKAKKVK